MWAIGPGERSAGKWNSASSPQAWMNSPPDFPEARPAAKEFAETALFAPVKMTAVQLEAKPQTPLLPRPIRKPSS